MKQYRITKEGLKQIQSRNLKRAIPIVLCAIAITVAIVFSNKKESSGDASFWLFVFPTIFILLCFSIYRSIKKSTNMLARYSISLSSNLISREQANTPTLSLYFNEITAIERLKSGNIAVKGKERTDIIFVLKEMEGFEEIMSALNAVHPVTNTNQTSLQRYSSLFVIVSLACMVCVYTVANKVIVAIGGLVVIVVLLRGFIAIWRNKNIDSRTKKSSWWMLLVLVSVLFTMITKLFLL